MVALGGPGSVEICSPSALESLGSSFHSFISVLVCLPLFIVSTVFLPYQPIHLHFVVVVAVDNPLQPVPLLEVRM